MGTLCEGLNHLSREEARQRYEQRLREQRAPVNTRGFGGDSFAREPQGGDWLDNLDQEDWEQLIGGPDDSPFD